MSQLSIYNSLKIENQRFSDVFRGYKKTSVMKWVNLNVATQPAFTCSKLTIETLEQGVKYVQS